MRPHQSVGFWTPFGPADRAIQGSLNTTEIFDPTTGAFTSGQAMSVARAGHSATLFADARVLIVNGTLFVN